MGLFYGNVALGGGGLILVDALPTANATEYNKHNLYLYNGEIYYITEDSGTYAYEKLPEKSSTQSYQVTITASGNWNHSADGMIKIYDGQDNTGTLLLDQAPASKSAYPITLTVTSGYCYISVTGSFVTWYQGITSSDYTLTGQYELEKVATIDKDGTIDIEVKNFDD